MGARRRAGLLLVATVGAGAGAALTGPATTARAAVDTTTVVVQGGTTPTDSGLLDAVIIPGFKAAYPQYNLKYVSVGTGQAITNAESGGGDVVLTHSITLENTFVAQGYSYEPGGRLVFTSDFVTVGPASDPAGLKAGPQNDVVAAYKEIAAAGEAGKADFVSRGDASGTNTKEQAIFKLAGVPINTKGDPGTPGTATDASWYHRTGKGQGDNLVLTDQCPFTSKACYTLTDRGTYNAQVTSGAVKTLTVLSQRNTATTALGGADLVANPYHAYAVNPNKEPNVNLPGALAFINFLTSPLTQAQVAAYPSTEAPAFFPDAYPKISVSALPTGGLAGAPVTLTGSLVPNFPLDPAISGASVQLMRAGAPTTPIASTTVAANGTFTLAFKPTVSDTYQLFVPQTLDGLVQPTNTSFREPITFSVGHISLLGSTTLKLSTTGRIKGAATIKVAGDTQPLTGRVKPTIQLQIKTRKTGYTNVGKLLTLGSLTHWSELVHLPKSGTYDLRAVYNDPTVVGRGYSPVTVVTSA